VFLPSSLDSRILAGTKIGSGLIVLSAFCLQNIPARPTKSGKPNIRLLPSPFRTPKTSPMPSVAEQLRQAREAQNLPVEKVAEITKYRADHIRSVEQGNYNCFSAQVYVRGFVRTYATLLKLDVPQMMSALDAELNKTEKFREPPPLVERKRTFVDLVTLYFSRVDLKKTVILGGAALVILVVALSVLAWQRNKKSDPLKNLPPGVYQPKNSGETLPLPGNR
jgi:cytoskeletal protein RodZ